MVVMMDNPDFRVNPPKTSVEFGVLRNGKLLFPPLSLFCHLASQVAKSNSASALDSLRRVAIGNHLVSIHLNCPCPAPHSGPTPTSPLPVPPPSVIPWLVSSTLYPPLSDLSTPPRPHSPPPAPPCPHLSVPSGL